MKPFDQNMLDQIESRLVKCRHGYVKTYKSWSIVTTVQDLYHAGAVMTKERIYNIVKSCFELEGVDEACTRDVTKMLHDRYGK